MYTSPVNISVDPLAVGGFGWIGTGASSGRSLSTVDSRWVGEPRPQRFPSIENHPATRREDPDAGEEDRRGVHGRGTRRDEGPVPGGQGGQAPRRARRR